MKKFRGVSYHVQKGKYRAKLKIDNQDIWLGTFDLPTVAARVWDCAKRLACGGADYNFDGQAPPECPEEKIRAILVRKGVLRG
jgi:hypothetical protein